MSSTSSLPLAAPRSSTVSPNLKHAFGGIFRLTLRRYSTASHWVTLGGLLALLALTVFGHVSRQGRGPFLDWTVSFYLMVLVPAVAFLSAAGAMRDEMKTSTTDYVFTRPIPRRIFVLFRYAAHLACAQLDFLLALGVVLGMGFVREIPDLGAAVPRLLLGQVLLVAAFGAFGFFCSVLTSRYVIVGLLYGAVVEVGLGQIPTQLNRIAVTQQARSLLQPLLERAPEIAPLSPWAAAALALAFSAAMVAAAALLFSWRELAGQNDA